MFPHHSSAPTAAAAAVSKSRSRSRSRGRPLPTPPSDTVLLPTSTDVLFVDPPTAPVQFQPAADPRTLRHGRSVRRSPSGGDGLTPTPTPAEKSASSSRRPSIPFRPPDSAPSSRSSSRAPSRAPSAGECAAHEGKAASNLRTSPTTSIKMYSSSGSYAAPTSQGVASSQVPDMSQSHDVARDWRHPTSSFGPPAGAPISKVQDESRAPQPRQSHEAQQRELRLPENALRDPGYSLNDMVGLFRDRRVALSQALPTVPAEASVYAGQPSSAVSTLSFKYAAARRRSAPVRPRLPIPASESSVAAAYFIASNAISSGLLSRVPSTKALPPKPEEGDTVSSRLLDLMPKRSESSSRTLLAQPLSSLIRVRDSPPSTNNPLADLPPPSPPKFGTLTAEPSEEAAQKMGNSDSPSVVDGFAAQVLTLKKQLRKIKSGKLLRRQSEMPAARPFLRHDLLEVSAPAPPPKDHIRGSSPSIPGRTVSLVAAALIAAAATPDTPHNAVERDFHVARVFVQSTPSSPTSTRPDLKLHLLSSSVYTAEELA
ncbi:hypothetical protein HK405_001483 [Cladochytrium tenue]|nr:hypothetical protein HK405_001483 [Cladochytrium tenue]